MLVDSLALGISWAWLVVGIFVGVGLPILLVALWVRARRRQSEQE
jgi:pilus assembly protein TadC